MTFLGGLRLTEYSIKIVQGSEGWGGAADTFAGYGIGWAMQFGFPLTLEPKNKPWCIVSSHFGDVFFKHASPRSQRALLNWRSLPVASGPGSVETGIL